MKRYTFPLFAMLGIVAIATIAVLGFDISPASAGVVGVSVASIQAPNWYTIQYDTKVRHLLQNQGFLLRGATDAPVEVKGNTLQFFFLGTGEAVEMGQSVEDVKPVNLAKTTLTVDMKDYQFAEYVRDAEPERISPEYRSKIQEAGAMALGRKFDRIIMEAMDAEAGNIATIGDGSMALSPLQISTAKAGINAIGMMSMNEFYLPVPSYAWEQQKLYKIFNNRDYVQKSLFEGKVEATLWNGVWVFQCPDSMFTVPSANQIDTYLWNKTTVGFGMNYNIRTNITYENIKTAWLYNTRMSGAAKVLQTAGVRRVRLSTNQALTIN